MPTLRRAAPLAALLACGAIGPAQAQSWPNKPLRLIVAFPAGGPTDIQARLLGKRLAETLGQPVVVDNRGGAGGIIGAELAARAVPDGHTIFLATVSVVMTPLAMAKPPYDPVHAYSPISLISTAPYLMIVHPSVPARSVRELVALAKSRTGALDYGSSGGGTPPHLAGELFKMAAGIDMVHVPYKGAGPALTALLSGQVAMVFNNPIVALPHVKAGRVRALAVTTPKRARVTPEVPTMAEAGVPGVEVGSWFALLAPAGVPTDIVSRLHADTVKALGQADVRRQFEGSGAEPVGSSPAEAGAHLRAEHEKWGRVIRKIGFRMN